MTCFDRMRGGILFLVCGFAMTVAYVSPAGAQDNTSTAAATVVKDAAKKGFPLTSSSTDVTGNVSVEAGLIPARIAKTVFGKEISNNYAIIALTISNRSSDEAFIVHSVFIDYSQWLLSGGSPYFQANEALCLPASQGTSTRSSALSANDTPAGQQPSGRGQAQSSPTCGNSLPPWQQQTLRNQIDSVETRIVRGELLDRQPWTTRNWVLRSLQAAGSIASGFTFATSSDSWVRGIGAFNGSVIPAAQTVWPDATVGQMNRISDFGFQVNKVIAKQSSDIVVAFFPIERFLTPDLASLFISSPAAFFAPFAAIIDPKTQKRLDPYIHFLLSRSEIENMKNHLYQVVSGECPMPNSDSKSVPPDLVKACQTAEIVNRMSLNVVRVRVSGSMTVDVNKVPPQISEVNIDIPTGEDATSMWAKGVNLTGVIRGSFLGGGTPAVTNIDSKILQVQKVTEGSNDTELHFKMTLNDNLPAGTNKLSFQVSKKFDDSTITSATYDYMIQIPPQPSASTGAASDGAQSASSPTSETKPRTAAPAGSSGAPPKLPKPPGK
jgi:hypothetical protein